MLGITDLKVGTKIQIDGDPFVVTWNQHSKQARGGGVMKVKIRNLETGSVLERTFQGADKIEEADVAYRRAQFLYAQGGEYQFMDQETYDTVSLMREKLGDAVDYLTDGMEVDLLYFGQNPINIQLKPKLTFKVIETEPGVQGDRAQAVMKPATLETGKVVRVPPFINAGDGVVVNTDTGEYVERSKQ